MAWPKGKPRKQTEAEPFDDLPEGGGVPGAGFEDKPMPSQQVIDEAAAYVHQLSPEEILRSPAPVQRRPATDSPQSVAGNRPVREVVEQLLRILADHPDVKMLTSIPNSRPSDAQAMENTPRLTQHLTELRFVWRDPQPSAQPVQEQPKKPWKYANMIRQKAEIDQDKPEGRAAELLDQARKASFAYSHLVKKRDEELANK